jgi:hypothetical protein
LAASPFGRVARLYFDPPFTTVSSGINGRDDLRGDTIHMNFHIARFTVILAARDIREGFAAVLSST